MRISEIFYSIQGEGEKTGVPSVFVRTSGCPLRCVWCDTPYTSWKPEGEKRMLSEIFDEAHAFDSNHVVITGGEPFVDVKQLTGLVGLFKAEAYHVTIETAGIIFADVGDVDLMSISPKLSSSTPVNDKFAPTHDKLRLSRRPLWDFMRVYGHCQFKFVVQTESELNEVEALITECGLPRDDVMLMPEGRSTKEIQDKSKWLAEACKSHRVRFSPRLHIDIWGNKRGV